MHCLMQFEGAQTSARFTRKDTKCSIKQSQRPQTMYTHTEQNKRIRLRYPRKGAGFQKHPEQMVVFRVTSWFLVLNSHQSIKAETRPLSKKYTILVQHHLHKYVGRCPMSPGELLAEFIVPSKNALFADTCKANPLYKPQARCIQLSEKASSRSMTSRGSHAHSAPQKFTAYNSEHSQQKVAAPDDPTTHCNTKDITVQQVFALGYAPYA